MRNDLNTQDQYKVSVENSQLVLILNSEILLHKDAPVRVTSAQLEDLDYRNMNPHFRNVAKTCFPQAKIVADKCHVARQNYWAMDRARKNAQFKLSDRHRKYFKKSRYLLMKPMEKLTDEEMERLALLLEIASRLADAYRLKNEFLTVIRSDSSTIGRERLKDWLFSVELTEMDEFRDCVRAYRNWFLEILDFMDVPWTNGYFEGCNNETKMLKRTCYGMRNFNNFRKKIYSVADEISRF